MVSKIPAVPCLFSHSKYESVLLRVATGSTSISRGTSGFQNYPLMILWPTLAPAGVCKVQPDSLPLLLDPLFWAHNGLYLSLGLLPCVPCQPYTLLMFFSFPLACEGCLSSASSINSRSRGWIKEEDSFLSVFVVCWSSQWQSRDHKWKEMDNTFGEFLIASLIVNSVQASNCPSLDEKERGKEAVECRKARKRGGRTQDRKENEPTEWSVLPTCALWYLTLL